MFVTVPLRKNRHRKNEQKHQELIFKEIEYNSIFNRINQQEQLKKSNGFKAVKQKIITTHHKNLANSRSTLLSSKNGSNSFQFFKRGTSSVATLATSKERAFMSTAISTKANLNQTKIFQQTQISQQKQSQNKRSQVQQKFNSNSSTRPFSSSAKREQFFLKQTKNKFKHRRKNVTLLDLKVKNIEQIIKKAGKYKVQDFQVFAQKNQQKIKQEGWTHFFAEMSKHSKDPHRNINNFTKIKRTATSQYASPKQKTESEKVNIFIERKNKNLYQNKRNNAYASLDVSPKKQHESMNVSLYNANLQPQNMKQFFNLVKGGQNNDEYSNKISLKNYRKAKNNFYILQNAQQSVKQGRQFKKISMENFKNYKSGSVISFIYLNDNQYRLYSKKSQHIFKENDIVP